MSKLDLKLNFRHLYSPSAKQPQIVTIQPLSYLMVDGQGDPNTSAEYVQAIEILYSLSYTMKFTIKKSPSGVDYGVMPLEGLWWSDDMNDFLAGNKDRWKWTAMILQPDFITSAMVAETCLEVEKKKGLPAREKARLETFDEGLCAQIMHIGSYSEERPTIEKLHQYIADTGHKPRGLHHEIYLSDPRRADPAKLKTIIRQPICS